MKVSTTTYFDSERQRWRVRFRGAGLDTRFNPASGFVWPNNRSGQPTGNVTHTLNKLADDAGVRRFSLHDLRATGNTWLANHAVDERLRQYLMGHSAGGPVINRYTKVTSDTEKQLREAVAVFDEIRSSRENVASLAMSRRRRA